MPTFGSKQRPLAALAVFGAGAVVGLFLAPSPAITADGDATAVGAFAAALETRVAALEDLLLTHISAENQAPPKEGGTILKAPFNIVDDSNHVIFSVEADGGGGIVQVMSDGGKRGIRLDGATNRVTAEGDGGKVDIGDTGNGWGLVVSDGGGTPMADLSQPQGKGMALRIYNQGANAAQIGVAPGTGGLLRLFSNGDKRTIGLDSNADGTGTIQIAGKKGEDSGIKLDGQNERLLLDTTKGISTLGASETGWGLFIGDASGQPMAEVSEPAGKGMALRIYNQGANAAQIGVAPGTGGLLRLFADGDKRTIGLDSNADGSGTIIVTGKEGEDVGGIWLDGQKDVVRVKSDKGVAALGGDDQGWGMVVRDAGGNPQAGVNDPGGGMALRVYESGTEVLVAGSHGGKGGSVNVYSQSGKDAAAVMYANPDGSGSVQAGDGSGKKGIKMDGQNNVLLVDTDEGTAGLGAVDVGWGLAIGEKGGSPLADLAKSDGGGMAMRVYEGGQQSAALGIIPGQGGQLRLYGNTNLAVSAGADGEGGRLQVYNGGIPTAVMNGNQSIVAVVNDAGTPISMLMVAASGSGGKVQATDPGGSPVFKGGFVPDGPGVACVSNDGTKCLGIGLTGMEGFH